MMLDFPPDPINVSLIEHAPLRDYPEEDRRPTVRGSLAVGPVGSAEVEAQGVTGAVLPAHRLIRPFGDCLSAAERDPAAPETFL